MNSRTLGIILMVFTSVLHSLKVSAQEPTLKQKAQEAFKVGDYPQAISMLKQAVGQKPDDAEAYYYLGYFTHYLCYDSLPLAGFGEANSNEILVFLRKAVGLDPKLGNAFYFIGAEYGARFLTNMQMGNSEQMVLQLKKGREEGGFPDWLVEYNRNMLKSCEPNAILFTGGDSETGSAWYLQYVENYRRDVTVIPVGALQWPWYVLALKEKADLVTTLAPIGWSKDQIMALHPYKWKANKIVIPISEQTRKNYNLPEDVQQMEWLVDPNLSDGGGTYLSPNLAVMVDIIKTNAWKRPIQFSLGGGTGLQKGLQEYFQLCGITNQLLPIKVGKNIPSVNEKRTRDVLLDLSGFQRIDDVLSKDFTRNSGLLIVYRVAYQMLLVHRSMKIQDSGDAADIRAILETMKKALPEKVVPMPPASSQLIDGLQKKLGEIK